MKKTNRLAEKRSERKKSIFEIWLMSYFQIPKNIDDSQKCCETFEKYLRKILVKNIKNQKKKL